MTPEEYVLLYMPGHDYGYVDLSMEELLIEGFFEDWDDYIRFSEMEYDRRVDLKQTKELEMVAEARRLQKLGELPDEYFQDSRAANKRENFIDGAAPPDVIAKRYYRHLFLNEMMQNFTGVPNKLTPERTIKIVLGFDPEKGIQTAGFLSEVKKLTEVKKVDKNGKKIGSDYLISDGYIDGLIKELGAQDYIRSIHDHRRVHLETLLTVAGWSKKRRLRALAIRPSDPVEPEYYYEPAKKRVLMLGATAIRRFTLGKEQDFLKWLEANEQLDFQKDSNADLQAKIKQGKTIDLKDILLDPDYEIQRQNTQTNKYNRLSRKSYLGYGHLIVALTGIVNENLIKRMKDLEIGPGPWNVRTEFGDLTSFRAEIGASNKPLKWNNDFIESYILEVFGRYGEVNKKILDRLSAEAPGEIPTFRVIQQRSPNGLAGLLESLGLPPPANKKIGNATLVERGVMLASILGRVPVTREIIANVTDAKTVQKKFGSVSEYQRQVLLSALAENIKLAA